MSDVFRPERYHTTPRPYKVVGGTIAQQGLQEVTGNYLYYLHNMHVDGHVTRKSYAALIEQQKALISDPIASRHAVEDAWRRVADGRVYIGQSLGMHLDYGHGLEHYKKNALAYLDRASQFVDQLFTYREDNPDRTYYKLNVDCVGSDWLVTGKADYVGTYPKRIAKWLFKQHKIRLRECHLQQIGNLLAPHVQKEGDDVNLAFDQDYIEGSSASDYCHTDSCWWGEHRTGLREGFKAEGGWAIRQFDGHTPVSRCWIVWDKQYECYVLFNAYGKLELAHFARILSADWGLSYAQVKIDTDSDDYFINGGKGYIIGDTAKCDKLAGTTLEPYWHDPIVPPKACKCCSAQVEDLYEVRDVRDYINVCADCRHRCLHCSGHFTQDAMVGDSGYCTACHARMSPCQCCSNLTDNANHFCNGCVQLYNLRDVWEIDWDAMSYRFIPAQLPPTMSPTTVG